MKILYAIQGTGNGHISRARDIIPILQKHTELDLLISGTQADVSLPYDIQYQLRGMSFIFGKSGGIDLVETYRRTDTRRLYRDVRQLPVEKYDLVINDFEPVSAWACRLKRIPCVSLSHQSAILSPQSPRPERVDKAGRMILQHYAPAPARYGFHFACFDENVFTPVIRQAIRRAEVSDQGHYTVYLPAYSDEKIIKRLTQLPDVAWRVFSKFSRKQYRHRNVTIQPIEDDCFVRSMATGTGGTVRSRVRDPRRGLIFEQKADGDSDAEPVRTTLQRGGSQSPRYPGAEKLQEETPSADRRLGTKRPSPGNQLPRHHRRSD